MRHKNEKLLQNICSFVESFMLTAHRQPTLKETAERFGVSTATAHRYITELIDQGRLNGSSAKIITDKVKAAFAVRPMNVFSAIPCGSPLQEDSTPEGYIAISSDVLGPGDFFAVRANGDSMIDAGISDGDLVIAKVENSANYEDLVVALSDESSNTLKRYCYSEELDRPYLKAENPEFEDLYPENISIQGVAKFVIKQL